ncbi:MAG: sensor histidine kinase [Candidatus Dormibacterales bacterium]
MIARVFASFRVWLILAMVAAAAIGVALTSLTLLRVSTAGGEAGDRIKAQEVGRAIARRAAAGATAEELGALQSVLPSDQVIVERGGRVVFAGSSLSGQPLELSVIQPFPGGRVIVNDHATPGGPSAAELVLDGALPAALAIVAAAVAASLLTRAVELPVQRAVEVADRIAGGDLSARMGSSGPDELQHLGRAFDGMAERLEAADLDQRQFLADLGHEIATPVNTISGFGLALADGSLGSEAERQEAAGVLKRETERLHGLLDDLRRLTRLDLAEQVHVASVEIPTACAEIVARFLPEARVKDVRLDVGRGTPFSVVLDRRLLEMAVGNLVSNAIRYTPEGGRVHIRARQQGGRGVVAVKDTGVGISPEHQRRIFDRFYRVDQARARGTGGSGLGLSIALRAAGAMGGRIELESAPGKGSEFRLSIPLGAGARAVPGRRATAPGPRRRAP